MKTAARAAAVWIAGSSPAMTIWESNRLKAEKCVMPGLDPGIQGYEAAGRFFAQLFVSHTN